MVVATKAWVYLCEHKQIFMSPLLVLRGGCVLCVNCRQVGGLHACIHPVIINQSALQSFERNIQYKTWAFLSPGGHTSDRISIAAQNNKSEKHVEAHEV